MSKRKPTPYKKKKHTKNPIEPYPVTISFKKADGTREKIHGTVVADSQEK